MKYPAQFIGDVRPGFHLWVQSSTRSVEKATAQVAEVAA
jgi:hypothetical protein